MKICGACERELLPDISYSVEQRGLRQSSQQCTKECVAAGNQLAGADEEGPHKVGG